MAADTTAQVESSLEESITILAGQNGAQLQAPRSQLCDASPLVAEMYKEKPDRGMLYWNHIPVEYCKVYLRWTSTARKFGDLDVHMLTGWEGDAIPQNKKEKLIVVIPRLCQLWHYAQYFQDELLKSVIVDEIVISSSSKIPAETYGAFWMGEEDNKLRMLLFDYLVDTTTAQSFMEDRDCWPDGLKNKMLWWMMSHTSFYDRLPWNWGTRGDACRYHDHAEGACPVEDSCSSDADEVAS